MFITVCRYLGCLPLIMAFLLTASLPARAAEIRYISDKIRIYARAGAGTEFKLIAPLVTGDEVTLLGDNIDDWVHIGYGKNRDGWIQQRFLTEVEPAAKRLTKALARIEELEKSSEAKIVSLSNTNQEYRKGNSALLREVKELRGKLKKVETDYNTLRDESAEFLALQAEHRKLLEDNQTRREKEASIMEECKLLQTAYRIKWFVAGSAVLLIGFAIGLLMQAFRYRKKKGSSLSFK